MTSPDQRRINQNLLSGNQGENARLTVFGRDGAPAVGCVWANPDSRGMMTVSDYRAQGYRIVHPKEVSLLEGGTFTPEEGKDFGVMFEFDRKADRIVTKGEMVLMHAPPQVLQELKAQQRRLQDVFQRKGAQKEDFKGGADELRGGTGASVKVTEEVTLENLNSM